jgi:hypothetical protein
MNFSGFLVLPVTPQLKREVKFESSGTRTIVGTATAIPAFFRMQDDRWFACLGMRYVDIDLAGIYADVAPVADFRIEEHRIVRCRDIGKRENFFL